MARKTSLVVLRSAHTLIWFTVEAALTYVIAAGVQDRTDRRVGAAAAVVAAETAVYLANGAQCPLTGLAERLGEEHGSVVDIYLPRWLSDNLPLIHVPLVLLAIGLHVPNLRRTSRPLA